MHLTFLGAAQNVTGSRHLLEAAGRRVLVDCGLYQEREFKARNWDPFPVPPSSIDAVLLTHAHIDHCGYLPRLVRDGFRGPVFGTDATGAIAKIVLMDSAKLQAEDAEFKKRRHEQEHRRGPFPEQALYTATDVETCCGLFQAVRYDTPVEVLPGITATFGEAGHILGSASILVRADDRSIVFSGDIGRWNRPMLRDPAPCPAADYVVMESTYGDRLHESTDDIAARLAELVNRTRQRGGNLIIPTFAIERAQEVLYHLNELLAANRIPHLMVFLDSPMAVNVIDVFDRNLAVMDEEMHQRMDANRSPFRFSGLKLVRTVDESKAINHISGTVAVMAGAGMCTGGRVKHHLVNNISRPESTVLFVGYQAFGTLGRVILNGTSPVRILGQTLPVRAEIAQIAGFSAHADRDELLRWLGDAPAHPPRRIFVVHGEPKTAQNFAVTLRERRLEAAVPAYGARVTLT
jgi:metallo-beta-lactamase family protein